MSNNALTPIFDFFLPRLCPVCSSKLMPHENQICPSCFEGFDLASQDRIKSEFERKFREDKLIDDFASAFLFKEKSEIQILIHSLKYKQNFKAGQFLGKKIVEILNDKIKLWNADLIIPIPLHNLRKSERGFNQSNEIVRGISKETKIKFNHRLLKRTRFTFTQTKFSLSERKENVNQAFKITNSKQVKNKSIIIVDDVITTGATITECAKVLKKAGANSVFALSAALAN